MNGRLFYTAGNSAALPFAVDGLRKHGFSFSDSPTADVTNLLLPVPCKLSSDTLEGILECLPEDISIFGGFLDRPELCKYTCYDLLKNEQYLAQNASITAYCATTLAASQLPITWDGCPVLILGWGRIGTCLGQILGNLGAEVTIAARKFSHRAMIHTLGYNALDIYALQSKLGRYRVIFNTVPCPVITAELAAECSKDCLMLELASSPGICANRVVSALGLPGKYAPESSGTLIADTIYRILSQKEA